MVSWLDSASLSYSSSDTLRPESGVGSLSFQTTTGAFSVGRGSRATAEMPGPATLGSGMAADDPTMIYIAAGVLGLVIVLTLFRGK